MLIFLLLKVLVVSDIKQGLGYFGPSKHKAWRAVRFSPSSPFISFWRKIHKEKFFWLLTFMCGVLMDLFIIFNVILYGECGPRYVGG